MPITPEAVKEIVVSSQQIPPPTDVPVNPVDLKVFDELYTEAVVV